MKKAQIVLLLIVALSIGLIRTAGAAEILVTANIGSSQTWTANNTYNLQNQIYVLPGATLTIQAGTVVKSTANIGGSLAVCRGAKIFANGTASAPIIFTSTLDTMTAWHEGANEWGNVTIMGRALVSKSTLAGNTATPTGLNTAQMEGLTAAAPGDPNVVYGGNDDNDDSGGLHYVSLRFGGKVIALANELNGLSVGGVGRETDMDHIEIMNNVDDGIETWGGTVNYKYVSIWNIGDDCFDVDQGWRGKLQFGLMVQGYSTNAAQGSGVGDNVFETDGAEDSDAQPVTTAVVYNCTVIGQPIDGDHGTAWRDNARVQYRNCIFMDLGERLVSFDNVDGDGASGYGFNGTLSWANTWTTAAGTHSTVNAISPVPAPGTFNHPNTLYQAQTTGNLAEITDSVFYNNVGVAPYTESDARGVTVGGASNPAKSNVVAAASPIQTLTRGPLVVKGGKNMVPVTFLNPLPANDAIVSVGQAPNDGFFTPAKYRGAFAPHNNWLAGWTATNAYGFTNNKVNVAGGNINVSETWAGDNEYNLLGQVYIEPGATLTIEPGTLVKSTTNGGGSLAVTSGAKIFVNGTQAAPVIMTSTSDTMTAWHEGANEWGNLTVMGKALISKSTLAGNTATPTGLNKAQMEGLTAAFPGDPNVAYGGNDDNDDSGSIHYLSLRYGGKVIALANELNGLSLGGIGRETEIDHIDIMNNVDDGIEIWGGTVGIKYANIWNIGDDCFDVDQGWRGKLQFGLMVQGYSVNAVQGSGVGDNVFETDGAENSDAQPVTTAVIYNCTSIGQPIDGDHGTAWRDNARIQYRNCIFQDLGERLVSFDNVDGDGGAGYGFNGTLAWANTWATSYTQTSAVNAGSFAPGAFNDPAVLYTAQKSGNLAEITDSVFYSNVGVAPYTESNTVGVTIAGGSNPAKNNIVATASPVVLVTRGPLVVKGGKNMLPVTFLNPLPAADALTSVGAAPNDGFFTAAQYRGAFAPGQNWLAGWTAPSAYGMTSSVVPQNAAANWQLYN